MKLRVALAALLVVPFAPLADAQPQDDEARVEKALELLASTRPAEGHWVNGAYYVEAAASAGIDVKRWPSPERSAWDLLAPDPCPFFVEDSNAATRLQPMRTKDPARCPDYDFKKLLRVAHAAGVAGYDPRDIRGLDAVAAIRANFTNGQFGDPAFLNDDMWAILALRAGGVPADDPQVSAAADAIRRAQLADGGWHHQVVATTSDFEITAYAIVALKAAKVAIANESGARAYVTGQWDAEKGGFRGGTGTTVQSTVWGIHALSALGMPIHPAALDLLRSAQADNGRIGVDAWSTSEAAIVLAGARYPLPGFTEASPGTIACHAREPARILPASPFTSLRITWDDGSTGSVTFQEAGPQRYRYLAEGPGVRVRGEGVVDVLSARPRIGALPSNVTLARHAPLALDLGQAHDPDGRIETFEVDWGDGNVTSTKTHAYAQPGSFTLSARARDDAGLWSDPATMLVNVTNAPPTILAPARLVADRVTEIAPNASASDPDGDAIALRWSFGNASGEGSPRITPTALGIHRLELRARDPFGAEANATILVEVVNLAPSVRFLDGEDPRADASDPDGPAPTLAWTVDGAAAAPPIRLAPGTHAVRVVATDADGASANATRTFVVPEADAPASPPTAAAPEILAFEVALVQGRLEGSFAANATATRIAWRTDVGDGEREVTSPFAIEIPAATWATARLLATRDGLEASRDSALLTIPVAPPARVAPSAPAAVVVAASPEAPKVPEGPTGPESPDPALDLEPASLKEMPAAERRTPGAPAWLAILLATLGTLAASQARSPRRERR